MNALFLGADLGGSWLRVAAVDRRGRVVFRHRSAACAPEELPDRLARIMSTHASWPGRKRAGPYEETCCVVGSTRLGDPRRRRAVEDRLKRVFDRVQVMTDMELAHLAAFGRKGGVLIIAGTGSAAFGRDGRGRPARAGGLGPRVGDEGSAFWLGDRHKRAPRKLTPDAVRRTAARAKALLRRARRDPEARELVERGQRLLIGQAASVARKLKLRAPVPVCLHGGLFRDRLYLAAFKRNLKASGIRWTFARKSRDAATAASLSYLVR